MGYGDRVMPDWEEAMDPRFEPLDDDDDELVLDPWDEPFEDTKDWDVDVEEE